IPSASKLNHFLFETREGYCAYYAGATLFMLRSLGIPSRIAVGFMTIDRSDKNKGWYWYYADQAHAWVQIYLPDYGWLDFDTTVGNDEARESPSPDGTPPLPPPIAVLSISGLATEVDTSVKQMVLETKEMTVRDQSFEIQPTLEKALDLSRSSIWLDTLQVG